MPSVIPQKFHNDSRWRKFVAFNSIYKPSSLKHLPTVLRDLSVAINEPTIQEEVFSGVNGLAIYLYDCDLQQF
jgi:hypothetical protein